MKYENTPVRFKQDSSTFYIWDLRIPEPPAHCATGHDENDTDGLPRRSFMFLPSNSR